MRVNLLHYLVQPLVQHLVILFQHHIFLIDFLDVLHCLHLVLQVLNLALQQFLLLVNFTYLHHASAALRNLWRQRLCEMLLHIIPDSFFQRWTEGVLLLVTKGCKDFLEFRHFLVSILAFLQHGLKLFFLGYDFLKFLETFLFNELFHKLFIISRFWSPGGVRIELVG